MATGRIPLAAAVEMAEADTALKSMTVSSLLNLIPDLERAQVRRALDVSDLTARVPLGTISAETAANLEELARSAVVEAPRSTHFPFWDDPEPSG